MSISKEIFQNPYFYVKNIVKLTSKFTYDLQIPVVSFWGGSDLKMYPDNDSLAKAKAGQRLESV